MLLLSSLTSSALRSDTKKMCHLLYVTRHLSSEQPSLDNLRGNSAFSSTIDLDNRIQNISRYNSYLYLNPNVSSRKKVFQSKIVFNSGTLLVIFPLNLKCGKLVITLQRMKAKDKAVMKKHIFSFAFICKCNISQLKILTS